MKSDVPSSQSFIYKCTNISTPADSLSFIKYIFIQQFLKFLLKKSRLSCMLSVPLSLALWFSSSDSEVSQAFHREVVKAKYVIMI